MTSILLVSVGGSHQPIVSCIKELQPDRVIFFCSDGPRGSKSQVIGEGTPCEVRDKGEVVDRLPNIVRQCALDNFNSATDVVLIQDPDDFSECYCQSSETIKKMQTESPDHKLMADYTGGTKTMSVGLASAALDRGIKLYLTTGIRTNLIKVEAGQITSQTSVNPIIFQRSLEKTLPELWQEYNYAGVVAEIKRLNSLELSASDKRYVHQLYRYSLAFEAWDKFDHETAWGLLGDDLGKPELRDNILFLKRVLNSRAVIDPNFQTEAGIRGHGYEIVEDLLLNADRRATQQRYDDAVGRLYRALELVAQIRLASQYQLSTGNLDLTKLPEGLQLKYKGDGNGKIKIALRKSYELLAELPDDSVGKVYREYQNKVNDALLTRNNSLFAHGFQPINKADYEKFRSIMVNFIEEAIKGTLPPNYRLKSWQFPRTIPM